MDKLCQYLSKFLFRSIVPCLTEIIHVPLSLCLATQLEANFGKYLVGRAGFEGWYGGAEQIWKCQHLIRLRHLEIVHQLLINFCCFSIPE